mgnify:CR=1 FL=1
MIIATAGHVDHGKTSLVQALTGINTSRLPEEKTRGMTIDLGYAYWPQEDGRVIGFIDVPGHEKFINNMLSGISGIDHALLVVACDDGVMPQTTEHLTLLSLLGRPSLTIALTKSDRSTPQQIDTVARQVTQLATGLGWQNPHCFICSLHSPESLTPLAGHLCSLHPLQFETECRFRLAIDRVFTLKGTGLIVTGTCLSGEVVIGETLWLTGAGQPVRVRGINSHNRSTERGTAGKRLALNLTGDINKTQINRGDWLLAQQPPPPAERVVVALEGSATFHMWQPVHIHHSASHVTGRILPLVNHLAELAPDKPLWLANDDRLILRDISVQQTLAGGRVILLTPKKRGKRQPDYLAWLQALADAPNTASRILTQLSTQPGSLTQLGWATQLTAKGLQAALAPLEPLIADDDVLLPEQAVLWKQRLTDALISFHQNHSGDPGPASDRLRRIALTDKPPGLVLALIRQLLKESRITSHRGWLCLPDFKPQLTAEEQALWQHVLPLFKEEA